jgi:hypothetical protein
MYDKSIYFTAMDNSGENPVYSLYRVAPDGSALDKIREIYSSEHSLEYGCDCSGSFIIHRGYAFIEYEICSRSSYGSSNNDFSSFIECGLIKINLKTGEKETLRHEDSFFDRFYIEDSFGCSDRVVFTLQNADRSRKFMIYDLTEGTMTNYDLDLTDRYMYAADSEKIYFKKIAPKSQTGVIEVYDVMTMDKINEYDVLSQETLLVYNGIRYITSRDHISVYRENEKISEYTITPAIDLPYRFSITNGRLYKSILRGAGNGRDVEYCEISDIMNGNWNWKKAYSSVDISNELFSKLMEGESEIW